MPAKLIDLINITSKSKLSDDRKGQIAMGLIDPEEAHIFGIKGFFQCCLTKGCRLGHKATPTSNHLCKGCGQSAYRLCSCGMLLTACSQNRHRKSINHIKDDVNKFNKALEEALEEKKTKTSSSEHNGPARIIVQANVEDRAFLKQEGIKCCWECNIIAKSKEQVTCEECGCNLNHLAPECFEFAKDQQPSQPIYNPPQPPADSSDRLDLLSPPSNNYSYAQLTPFQLTLEGTTPFWRDPAQKKQKVSAEPLVYNSNTV